ncbi:MAG TPA: NUDIX pyrophosphatase [Caulobacteraceae bacterium]
MNAARTPECAGASLPPHGRSIDYAIFRRADDDGGCWQGVAGGAEFDETPRQAAVRELSEETGIDAPGRWIALDSIGSVPASVFGDGHGWGPEVYVVIERAFGVEVSASQAIALSAEHADFAWLPFDEALNRLRFDSNRTALWELNERLAREA